MPSKRRGLECRIGERPFVLDARLIEQLIELSVSPLPLARAPISGMAAHDDALVVVLRLEPGVGGLTRREGVKAILLTERAAGQARWALEVEEVRSFVDVAADARGDDWLDVDRLMGELDAEWGKR